MMIPPQLFPGKKMCMLGWRAAVCNTRGGGLSSYLDNTQDEAKRDMQLALATLLLPG